MGRFDSQHAAIGPGRPQHRHVVIDGALQGQSFAQGRHIGFVVIAAVDGEVAPARSPGEVGVAQLVEGLLFHEVITREFNPDELIARVQKHIERL